MTQAWTAVYATPAARCRCSGTDTRSTSGARATGFPRRWSCPSLRVLELAKRWCGEHLSPNWTKKSVADARALRRIGLHTSCVAPAVAGRPVLEHREGEDDASLAMIAVLTSRRGGSEQTVHVSGVADRSGPARGPRPDACVGLFEGRAPASAGETKNTRLPHQTARCRWCETRRRSRRSKRAAVDAGRAAGSIRYPGAVAASFRFGDQIRPLRQGEDVAFRSTRFFQRVACPSIATRWSLVGYGVAARRSAAGTISGCRSARQDWRGAHQRSGLRSRSEREVRRQGR